MFSENLSHIMKTKGVSGYELARRSGVAESTISRYRANQRKPRFDCVVQLAQALGVSLDDLVKGDK